jgi:hypothetical protein
MLGTSYKLTVPLGEMFSDFVVVVIQNALVV